MSSTKKLKTHYLGSGVPVDTKRVVTKLAVNLRHRGVKIGTNVECLNGSGYQPGRSTLLKNIATMESGNNPFSDDKTSGKPALLTDEQWRIICGWILVQNDAVDYEEILDWIDDTFDVSYDKGNLSRKLNSMGLSVQLKGGRAWKSSSFKEYAQGYFEFILKVRKLEAMKIDKKRITALDFATNSYCLHREITVQMQGQKQKKINRPKSVYTNSYLAAAAWESGLGLQALMFTFDPVFDSTGNR